MNQIWTQSDSPHTISIKNARLRFGSFGSSGPHGVGMILGFSYTAWALSLFFGPLENNENFRP